MMMDVKIMSIFVIRRTCFTHTEYLVHSELVAEYEYEYEYVAKFTDMESLHDFYRRRRCPPLQRFFFFFFFICLPDFTANGAPFLINFTQTPQSLPRLLLFGM